MLHLEISRGEKITVAADWWSLGVLSYELITGKVETPTSGSGLIDLLFTSISDIHNYNAIQSGLDLIIPKAKTIKSKMHSPVQVQESGTLFLSLKLSVTLANFKSS